MKTTKTITITWTEEDIKLLLVSDLAREMARSVFAHEIALFQDSDHKFIARVDITDYENED